ncbi:MAG: hypothetical protein PGN11_12330 [Quadrisphaera sp.]
MASLTEAPPVVALSPTPARAAGLELLGEFHGSGSSQPPCLVRRADGQVVQLSPLVYRVLEALDGRRDAAELAAAVSGRVGRELDADGIRFLVAKKLAPIGLVDVGATAPPPPRAAPLLALQGRTPLLGPRGTGAVAVVAQPLFRPPVVLATVVALGVLDVWIFFVHGLGDGLRALVADPAIALLLFGVSIVAGLVHECGHAAACRYGGARPGTIGMGLFLVWPTFYTDVTDSYRLGRAGRVRTDLGGIYFHALVVLALGGLYAVTGAEWLLLAIVLIHLEVLEQLLPLVRFDGYYILADLVGVPDLFARIGPVLKNAVQRSGPRDPRVVGLRPWVRVLVTAWVVVVVPVLAINISVLVWHLPRLVGAMAGSVRENGEVAAAAVTGGPVVEGVLAAVNGLLLVLVLCGIAYLLQGLARRVAAAALQWSAGRPRRRAGVVAAGVLLLVGLVVSWVVTGQFTAEL